MSPAAKVKTTTAAIVKKKQGAPSAKAENRIAGRPREPQLDEAILGTALRHLAEKGYSRMSLDAIAESAAVSKPTIYRRWGSKAELASAAIAWNIDVEAGAQNEASAKEGLIHILRKIRARLLGLNGMSLVGTVLAEEKQTPELISLFRERVMNRRVEMARKILQEGNARGEVRTDVDLGAAVNMLIGSMYAVYIAEGSIPGDWPKRVVETLWPAIAVPDVS